MVGIAQSHGSFYLMSVFRIGIYSSFLLTIDIDNKSHFSEKVILTQNKKRPSTGVNDGLGHYYILIKNLTSKCIPV